MCLSLLFPLSLNTNHSYNNSNHLASTKIISRSQEKVPNRTQPLFGQARNLLLKISMLRRINLLMSSGHLRSQNWRVKRVDLSIGCLSNHPLMSRKRVGIRSGLNRVVRKRPPHLFNGDLSHKTSI